jgi:hypothetical protein
MLTKLRPAVEAYIPTADEAPPFGQAFAFPRSVDATEADVRERYGEDFAAAVANADVGVWVGPVRSRFGLHLINVTRRGGERDSRFEEVASHVAFTALVERREEAIDRFIQRAFTKVRVEVDGQTVTTLERTHRLASRDEASAEDGL